MKRAIVHAALAVALVFAFSGDAEAKTKKLTSIQIAKVQDRLQQLGFHPGETDGAFGAQTARAVAAFQRSLRMSPTGELDKKTYSLLAAPSTANFASRAPVTYAQQYTMPLQTNTYYAPSRPATSIGYAKPTTQSWQQPQYQYRMYQGDYMVQGQMRYIQGRGGQH